jgi:hypothetical protein
MVLFCGSVMPRRRHDNHTLPILLNSQIKTVKGLPSNQMKTELVLRWELVFYTLGLFTLPLGQFLPLTSR